MGVPPSKRRGFVTFERHQEFARVPFTAVIHGTSDGPAGAAAILKFLDLGRQLKVLAAKAGLKCINVFRAWLIKARTHDVLLDRR